MHLEVVLQQLTGVFDEGGPGNRSERISPSISAATCWARESLGWPVDGISGRTLATQPSIIMFREFDLLNWENIRRSRRWPSVERLTETSARILVGGRAYRDIDDRCWSAERRVADMDAESVALQVVSPTPVTFCHDSPATGATMLARAQNDFLAGLVAQRPDRFRALGAVPMQDPDEAVAELRRCVEDLGFMGVEIRRADTAPAQGFVCPGPGPDRDQPRTVKLALRLAGVPICTW
ncbi:MAG TPA: amidohydrolase family protein [Streptosporangiaceae bacterium]|nr:amidohydrolase family protein [Streptosporangiaceae bacterium]